MTTRYYKTDAFQALHAWRETAFARQELLRAGEACARAFGATAAKFLNNPLRFAGLHFDTAPNPVHWTSPNYNGYRLLRSRPTPSNSTTRAEHARLRELWDQLAPTRGVSNDPLFSTLRLPDSVTAVFYGGVNVFERDGWLYVAAGVAVPRMVEILGSEYEAAKNRAPSGAPITATG